VPKKQIFKTRLRAKLKGDIVEVKALVIHPMKIGEIDLETGVPGKGHFIEEVKCTHNDKVVMSGFWSTAVSKNPFCSFKFKGGEKGDQVEFSWKDNEGNTGSKRVRIK
jgi:sulfur-oxidizing protein SoxZ